MRTLLSSVYGTGVNCLRSRRESLAVPGEGKDSQGDALLTYDPFTVSRELASSDLQRQSCRESYTLIRNASNGRRVKYQVIDLRST